MKQYLEIIDPRAETGAFPKRLPAFRAFPFPYHLRATVRTELIILQQRRATFLTNHNTHSSFIICPKIDP